MEENARRLLVSILLVLGTFVSVMGYNFTGLLIFVPIPFLAGVGLVVLIVKSPAGTTEEVKLRDRQRRRAIIQFFASCAILAVLIVVSAARNWGADKVTSYAIMEVTLGILACLTLLSRRRPGRLIRRAQEERDSKAG